METAGLACPSPNHGDRRGGLRPELVVLHYTAMASAQAALERLCDPAFEVSAHWLIGRDGRLWSLVPEERRAWHAGAGSWGGRGDVNSRSIGIEIDNDGRSPFSAPALARLERLLPAVMARWAIPPEGVIAHSDLAPGRKADPGPRFDWRRLARLGLSVWPGRGGNPEAPLLASLRTIGYPAAPAETLLAAFRLRFRPWAAGPEAEEDRALADDLARRYPACGGGAA